MKKRKPFALAVLAWTLWSSSVALDPTNGRPVSQVNRLSVHGTKEECEFALDRQIAWYAARNWEVKGARHVVAPDKGVVAHFGCLPGEAKPQQ